jgi:hypothetical protein
MAEISLPLFDEPLPTYYQGRTDTSRRASRSGAVHALKGRGEKVATYLQLLRNHGPMTDQDVAAITRWPLASVNSIRASLGDQIVECGDVPSPVRGWVTRTRWGVRTR